MKLTKKEIACLISMLKMWTPPIDVDKSKLIRKLETYRKEVTE